MKKIAALLFIAITLFSQTTGNGNIVIAFDDSINIDTQDIVTLLGGRVRDIKHGKKKTYVTVEIAKNVPKVKKTTKKSIIDFCNLACAVAETASIIYYCQSLQPPSKCESCNCTPIPYIEATIIDETINGTPTNQDIILAN